MADTTLELNAGSGGSTLAVDDIAGAVYQYVGLTYGGSGSKTAVSNTNPLPVKIGDGTDYALVTGSGELTVSLTTALPAGTNAIGKLAANSGVDIGDVDVTSFPATVHSADFDSGGGTDTTLAFGIAVPASGGAAIVPGSATAGLKVDLGTDNDVTVTGTVTANAGTNLNTSALALESGGNLAGAATSLAVIDDWDESDRAKVNIIAGQAGITAGAGAVGASTPRMTLASDDPAVALLTTIDGDTGNIATAAAAIQTASEAIQAAVEGTLTVTGDGGGTEYTEDAAAAANPVGGALIVIREDGRAGSLTTTDGDNVALRGNNFGELYVKHTDTIAVTQSGTWDEVGINDSGNSITVDDGGITLSIDDGGGVITVDGTVAVTNAGLTELAAAINASSQMDVNIAASSASVAVTNAGITTIAGAVAGSEMQVDVVGALPTGDNGIGRVKLTDGTDVADVLDLASSNPLAVAIVDASGDQISSFGGGTQYTEADTDASITGTAMMWEDTSDTLRAVSAAKPLPVNVITGGSAAAASVATSQVSVTSSAATLIASRSGRTRLTLVNRGSVSAFVGPATVSTSNGIEMKPGDCLFLEMAGTTLQGITASGSTTVHVMEEYT